MKARFLAAIFLVNGLGALTANASTITYTLTHDACTGTCGTAPFGTIQLTDAGPGSTSVTVTETLASGEDFIKTGAGNAIEFNVDKSVTLSGFTTGFSAGPSPASASAFGSFTNSVTCSGCGNGASAPLPGPLTFTVTAVSGGLTVADFVANTGTYFFASDILGANGHTGNVAATGPGVPTSATPEPASLGLALTGLVMVGLGIRRAKA